ncbi:MAG: glutamate formiminotransferase, partial [Clostridiales bacterium]|nr:glutamate formiminotransferase [Clostridiales bacterium]
CNMVLNTDDVSVAREIARRVRASSGGLDGVKALGLYLAERNAAQVSMNVCDFRATPLAQVFARVKEAAARLGFAVVETELIGLPPAEALVGCEEYFEIPMTLEKALGEI